MQRRVRFADQLVEQLDQRAAQLGGGVGVHLRVQLELRRALRDMLAPDRDQVIETVQDRGFGRGAGQAGEEAVAGQHGGVDAVVLGKPADGFGEAPGAQRVDRDGFETGVEQALVQLAVVAPGGFEDGAGDAGLDQPVAQSAAAGLGVGEVTGLAARFEMGVESGLADIDAGDYSWGGNGHCCVVFLSNASGHSCVPVLLRCGSVPTLPLRAHRNCCDGPTKLNTAHKAEVGNGPARRHRWGQAWPHRRPPRTEAGRDLIPCHRDGFHPLRQGKRYAQFQTGIRSSAHSLYHKRWCRIFGQ